MKNSFKLCQLLPIFHTCVEVKNVQITIPKIKSFSHALPEVYKDESHHALKTN